MAKKALIEKAKESRSFQHELTHVVTVVVDQKLYIENLEFAVFASVI